MYPKKLDFLRKSVCRLSRVCLSYFFPTRAGQFSAYLFLVFRVIDEFFDHVSIAARITLLDKSNKLLFRSFCRRVRQTPFSVQNIVNNPLSAVLSHTLIRTRYEPCIIRIKKYKLVDKTITIHILHIWYFVYVRI